LSTTLQFSYVDTECYERFHLKAKLKWAAFKTLAQLQAKVDQLLAELTPAVIASITGYPFILDALYALNTV
jgi:putative transposase